MATEVDPEANGINKKKLMKLLTSPDENTARKYSRLWAWYEIKVTNLDAPDDVIEKLLDKNADGARGLALIENHYVANDWFLKKDQLMKNIDSLKDIPAILINGRYDMMTPPITAHRLQKMLPNSKLYIVEASGHSDWEPGIAKKMFEAVKEFEKME